MSDENLLDSSLARPQQSQACGDPPADLADLAASLAFGLTRNKCKQELNLTPFMVQLRRCKQPCFR
ncbi:MAG: hypothetical protein OQK79_03645 [Rhodanobacter sp.]|nr:hypothetical protein [Rhodanobacter sp.]